MNWAKIHINNIICITCVFLILLSSCSISRYIPENQYLLEKVKVQVDNPSVSKKDLRNFSRQKPNTRLLGMKVYMRMYLLSNPAKENKLHRALRKNGEAPVIYDEFLTSKSASQMKLYLQNKGYYDAIINDTIRFSNRKAYVTFGIKTREAYRISEIRYQVDDSLIAPLIMRDTINSFLKKGGIFDLDTLQAERRRIENYFRSIGFYDFTKQSVVFLADTMLNGPFANVTVIIKKYSYIDSLGNSQIGPYYQYRFRNIYLFPEFDQQKAFSNYNSYFSLLDTNSYKGVFFVGEKDLKINKDILYQSLFISPGGIYSSSDVQKTYDHLAALRRFKLVNIQFTKDILWYDSINNQRLLDCQIFMLPSNKQYYAVQLEGTNSSGNLGGGINLIYQHKSLFNGFEILDVKIRGAYEATGRIYGIKNTIEIGTEAKLQLQKFLLPVYKEQLIKKYNPKTLITLAYNYQKRPIYTRTIANFEFGYTWSRLSEQTHFLSPFVFNMVDISDMDKDFFGKIDSTYLAYSYNRHIMGLMQYTYIFSNQVLQKRANSKFLRFNIETAGNLLTLANQWFNQQSQIGVYELFGIVYSQFIKGEADLRYLKILDEKRSLAWRFFLGIGVPYGNSKALPFEKKYFGGGANSLRAWQIRTLGPGSYDNSGDIINFPNQTSDMKLEGSMEYRFKMFWIIEGAIFIDAGNIWAINSTEQRPGAKFKINSFYKEIAVGSGFGFRFDFSFFMLRLDMGMKVRNPAKPIVEEKWIWNNPNISYRDDFNITFGIGYPF